jgi:class 3 adenylate cyclase
LRNVEGERFAEEAIRIGCTEGHDAILARGLHARALLASQRLDLQAAVTSWREALSAAQVAGDRWVEGWALQRLPLALTCLGELDDAERAATNAEAWTRENRDSADLSLVLAAETSIALARGQLDSVETTARETMRMVRRSRYPWGGAIALVALAQARALRADFEGAADALGLLCTPGEVFDEPGPAVRLAARAHAVHFEVEASIAAGGAVHVPPDLEGLARALSAAGSDANALSALCATAETVVACRQPALAALLRVPIEKAVERGIVLANGGVVLLERVLGILHGALGDVGAARATLERAADTARRIGARAELSRTLLALGELEVASGFDAAAKLAEAMQLASVMELTPTLRRAAKLIGSADPTDAPQSTANHAARPALPRPDEMRLLLALSRDPSLQHAARDLLLSEATVRSRLAHIEGESIGSHPDRPFLDAAEIIVLATDVVGSTSLLVDLGERRALKIFRLHHAALRRCMQRWGGYELDETGDGFLVGFRCARNAAGFALEAREAAANLDRAPGGEPLHLRIGIDEGQTYSREGRKRFGASVVGAVRLCSTAAPDEILLSERAAAAAIREGSRVAPHGERELKGLPGRAKVYLLQGAPAPATLA